jgi:hypothetical protein
MERLVRDSIVRNAAPRRNLVRSIHYINALLHRLIKFLGILYNYDFKTMKSTAQTISTCKSIVRDFGKSMYRVRFTLLRQS